MYCTSTYYHRAKKIWYPSTTGWEVVTIGDIEIPPNGEVTILLMMHHNSQFGCSKSRFKTPAGILFLSPLFALSGLRFQLETVHWPYELSPMATAVPSGFRPKVCQRNDATCAMLLQLPTSLSP